MLYLIILIILCASYYYIGSQKEKRLLADAGALSIHSSKKKLLPQQSTYRDQFTINGKVLCSSEYYKLEVNGSCMEARKIYNGNVIFVKKFNKNFTRDDIKPNDILLIYLNDERYKGYKLRVMKKLNEANTSEVVTFYYDPDGTEHFSSHNHKLSNVVGVLKYQYNTSSMN